MEENNTEYYTDSALKAMVEFIIPRTPRLAKLYGDFMYYGALDLQVDEYVAMLIDNYGIQIPVRILEMPSMYGYFNRFVVLGFYSEWFGYGSTRFNAPGQRIREFDPISWEQVGYPGPSLSYITAYKQYIENRNKPVITSLNS